MEKQREKHIGAEQAADAAVAAAAAAVPSLPAVSSLPLVAVYTQTLRSLLPRHLSFSPAAITNAEKCAALDIETVFLATNRAIHMLQPNLNPGAGSATPLRAGRQGPYYSDFLPLHSRITTLQQH